MKRLIVNADDFGWSEAVNEGILQSHLDGIVTSTTLMTNLPGAAAALSRARCEAPSLGIGLHLNLTEGTPLSKGDQVVPIVDELGNLRRSLVALFQGACLSGAVRKAIGRELEAQAAWASDHHMKPSHIDSHKHVHLHPVILRQVIAIARRHGIGAVRTTAETGLPSIGSFLPRDWSWQRRFAQWMRAGQAKLGGLAARRLVRRSALLTTDWFFGVRTTGGVSPEVVKHLLENAPAGTGELMVHVGLADDTSARPTRLTGSRLRELESVTRSDVKEKVLTAAWQLITFKELTSEPRV